MISDFSEAEGWLLFNQSANLLEVMFCQMSTMIRGLFEKGSAIFAVGVPPMHVMKTCWITLQINIYTLLL